MLTEELCRDRSEMIASYKIEHKVTVLEADKHYHVSKSTVHKDVAERLLDIDPGLARQARIVLDINKSERHIRGGMATKEKYLHQHMLHAFMAKS